MVALTGKVAFVTGAGSGIGRASARAIAQAGASVMLIDIDPAGLLETEKLISASGGAVDHRIVDIADPSAVRDAVGQTISRFGGLHLAHNNAGILGPQAPMVSYPMDKARRIFDVNVFGLLACMQAQIEHMLENGGGRIVNTASVSSFRANPGLSVYTASKHAVVGLTKSAALEYSGHNIGVNCVCPGPTETNMIADPSVWAAAATKISMGRVGQPEDIAKATVWLLSDEAAYISGDCMIIDGGYSTH